jgi:hypothetical protein
MRFVLILVMVAVCSATSCITMTGIAVAPSKSPDSGSPAESAFALAARVSQQHGLLPRSPQELKLNDLSTCYEQDYQNGRLLLCGKTKNSEVHFMLSESMTPRFTPHADTLRQALLDSLRAHFGQLSTRECEWKFRWDPSQSGC